MKIGPHLTSEEREEVCSLLGQFKHESEISQHVREKFGKSLTHGAIYSIKKNPKWQPYIEKYRQAYIASASEIAVTHKRVRLERLEQQYQEALGDKEKKKALKARTEARRELREILSAARDETSRQLEGANILAIQFNSLSHEELLRKRDELVNQVKTINLGRSENGNGQEWVSTEQKP